MKNDSNKNRRPRVRPPFSLLFDYRSMSFISWNALTPFAVLFYGLLFPGLFVITDRVGNVHDGAVGFPERERCRFFRDLAIDKSIVQLPASVLPDGLQDMDIRPGLMGLLIIIVGFGLYI